MTVRVTAWTCALATGLLVAAGCTGGSKPDDDNAAGGGNGLALISVTPNWGWSAGGAQVQLSGQGFQVGCTVTIAGALASGVTVASTSSLTCVTPVMPAGALGWQPVTVTNPGGASATLVQGFAYGTPPVPIGSSSAADPDVVADGASTVHLVWQSVSSSGATDVQYQRSSDGGQTWSATPVNLSGSANGSARPRIAARGTTVFAVWNETVASTVEVYHAYSTDGGQSWSSAARLVATAATPDPDVAIDGNGRVVIAFGDFSGGCAGCGVPSFAFIGALSGSAGGPYASSTANTGAVGPVALVADGNGNVLCASAGFSVAVARSTDGGQTWGLPVTLAAGSASVNYVEAAVALRGSSAVVVCRATGSTGSVQAFRSGDGGANWSGSVTIATLAGTAARPAATVDSAGDVRVVWADSAGAALDVFEAVSTDGGQNWGGATNLSANAGTSRDARVAAGASGFVIRAWADDTGQAGAFQVRTR